MKHPVLVPLFIAILGIFLVNCGASSTVETGATYDLAVASEDEVRAIFALAVLEECAETGVGIGTGITSALRAVESAGAKKFAINWAFRIDGKVARVFPSGKVSGELLRDLTSRC